MLADRFALILLRYFWAILILVTCLHARRWWITGKETNPRDAATTVERRSLLRLYLISTNLPNLAMGVLILSGRVDSLWEFLYPSPSNGYGWAWWGLVFVEMFIATVWLFLGGAERLASQPGLLQNDASPGILKTTCLAGLVAFAAVAVFVFIRSRTGA